MANLLNVVSIWTAQEACYWSMFDLIAACRFDHIAEAFDPKKLPSGKIILPRMNMASVRAECPVKLDEAVEEITRRQFNNRVFPNLLQSVAQSRSLVKPDPLIVLDEIPHLPDHFPAVRSEGSLLILDVCTFDQKNCGHARIAVARA